MGGEHEMKKSGEESTRKKEKAWTPRELDMPIERPIRERKTVE